MRCCLAAVGSRGDVAPFLAVARELAAAGHEVHLVVLADYAQLATAPGVVVHAVGVRQDEAMWTDRPWLRRAALAQPGVMYLMMRHQFAAASVPLAATLLEAARGCDVLVTGTVMRLATRRVAARLDVPMVTLLVAPLLPAELPDEGVLVPAVGGRRVGRAVSERMWTLTCGLGTGPARAVQHLLPPAPAGTVDELLVTATSPTLSPAPRVAREDLAGTRVARTGWVRTSGGGAPGPGLSSFLQDHPDAVVMGFGSCAKVDDQSDVSLFRAAAEGCGRPLVLQTPVLPPGPVDDRTWNAPGVDHALLLPRVEAVVHHGGAGTTLTALACGTPTVVVPHLGDQAYHARRVAALGAGVAAPPRWRTGATTLTDRLRRVLDHTVRERCEALAPRVADEGRGAAQVAALVSAVRGPWPPG